MRRLLSNWYLYLLRKQQPFSAALLQFSRNPLNSNQTNSNDYRGKNHHQHHWQWRWFTGTTGLPLLGFSMMTTFKNIFGTPPFQLDNDPLKHKIKEAWLYRKQRKYDKAVTVLDEAMQMAVERKSDICISRVIDELANTYFEMGKLDDAERAFRDLLQRLINLHKKQDRDPEFIGVSLKLSDIFAQKGKLDDAEIGFKHCVTRQMKFRATSSILLNASVELCAASLYSPPGALKEKVVEKHMAKYSITYGSSYDVPQVINLYGAVFTDPLALYGLCLEQYAHFIVQYREEKRLDESSQLMDEALKISHQIYGINCFHTINMLNNYGALLILRNRFDLARKYLEVGIDRILYVDECSSILPHYYCNYSEALYHCGEREEALKYARKATNLSHSESKEIQDYTERFLYDMEKDYNRRR